MNIDTASQPARFRRKQKEKSCRTKCPSAQSYSDSSDRQNFSPQLLRGSGDVVSRVGRDIGTLPIVVVYV